MPAHGRRCQAGAAKGWGAPPVDLLAAAAPPSRPPSQPSSHAPPSPSRVFLPVPALLYPSDGAPVAQLGPHAPLLRIPAASSQLRRRKRRHINRDAGALSDQRLKADVLA